MRNQIKNILDKPMDRKGFLKHLGVAMLFVAGGGMILNAANLQNDGNQKSLSSNAYGYGASAYGGGKVQS